MNHSIIDEACKAFYASLVASNILSISSQNTPSIADKANKLSCELARRVIEQLCERYRLKLAPPSKRPGRIAGSSFISAISAYLEKSFIPMTTTRPGTWHIEKGATKGSFLTKFSQYSHLQHLDKLRVLEPQIAATQVASYIVSPDVVIYRQPEDDAFFNTHSQRAQFTALRQCNNPLPLLHASISCKLTLRSESAQNVRNEAMCLTRNRNGRTPHIVVVTAEPLPSRLASIATGTTDVNCVYHIALHELISAMQALEQEGFRGFQTQSEHLTSMIEGHRLKDIADLPFDLTI